MRKFVSSVAVADGFIDGKLVYTSSTLMDSSLTQAVETLLIKGGVGNKVLAVANHSSEVSLAFTDTQWSLRLMALNSGATISNGGDIFEKETVTVTGNVGTLIGTPIVVSGTTIYAYTEYNDSPQSYVVTGQTFATTGVPDGTVMCVKYLKDAPTSQSIAIPSNITTAVIDLFLTVNLIGDVTGTGNLGTVTIRIPRFKFNGTNEIAMTADGVSNTPMSGIALEYLEADSGCKDGVYAIITENIKSLEDFSGATGLAVEGGDFELAALATKALRVYAEINGNVDVIANQHLTFTSDTPATATIDNDGVVTAVAAGTTQISVEITDNTAIKTDLTVTVA